MAENKVLAMVLAAKRTLAKFAKELDKATLKMVYGFGQDKIQNELVRLEQAKEDNVRTVDYYEEVEDPLTGEVDFEKTQLEVKSKDEYDETNR